MIEKTRGIVIHTVKHSDSGIIAHIFTEELGLLPVMVRGVHSKKGQAKNVYFQPLSLVGMELYYKEARDIQELKEMSMDYTYRNIPFDINRSTMAIFISEVLFRTLPEREPDRDLFLYINESLKYLDVSSDNISNFHISFLVGYSKYLGITPATEYPANRNYFDMRNGIFSASTPVHNDFFSSEDSELLYLFLVSTIDESRKILLSGSIRRSFLGRLLDFYSIHLPGMKKIKSLDVLSELFS